MLLILLPLQSKPFHFYLSRSVSFTRCICFSSSYFFLLSFERTHNDIMSTQCIALNTFMVCIILYYFIFCCCFFLLSAVFFFPSSHIMTVNRANSKNPLKTRTHISKPNRQCGGGVQSRNLVKCLELTN